MPPDEERRLEEIKRLFENSQLTRDEPSNVWLKSIRDKLFSMLRCPLKEDFRQEAFQWIANLCISIGDFGWLCPDDNWTTEEAKMLSCISRLSMSELQILLPPISRHLTCGDQPEMEDGKVMARSATSTEYDSFGIHLIIIESSIKTLVKDQDEEECERSTDNLVDQMDNNDLKSLLESLKELISDIIDYLELVHQNWPDLIKDSGSKKFLAAEGALRIMCVWLSEEPMGFESQCDRYLLELIINNLLLVDRPTCDDILILALHSVCTQNNDLMTKLRNTPTHREALQKYLDFVQSERTDSKNNADTRRGEKAFKLRCGLVKDLLTQ